MNDVQVTIWCLAYNHEKYIRSALDGFIMQKTNFKFEVIVHDDASTDNTVNIIREYERKYPDIIKPIFQTVNQEKLKVDKMSKFLIPNAKGKYIAFCEGDDFWSDENKLQLQYDYMESHSDVELCVNKVQYLNEDGSKTNKTLPKNNLFSKSKFFDNQTFAKLLFLKKSYPFHTSSFFIRKDLISSKEYKQLIGHFNGDLRILYTSLLRGNAYYIDKIMSNRRLFTIGNYNSRFNALSVEKKRERFINNVKSTIYLDKISNYKYHKMICSYVYVRIMIYYCIYGNEFKELLLEYKKENKFPWFYSIQHTIIYLLFTYARIFFKFIIKIYYK